MKRSMVHFVGGPNDGRSLPIVEADEGWQLVEGEVYASRNVGIRDGETVYDYRGDDTYVARSDMEGRATR